MMGSLPNLHELGKDNQDLYRPGPPALGHLCGPIGGGGSSGIANTSIITNPSTTLTKEERSKILHRYSGHGRITKARSNGNESKIIYDDFMLEHMATYSPISTRQNIRRRDSLTSSIGATSVRRLLAVVRPNHSSLNQNNQNRQESLQHSKSLLLTNLAILCICHLLITATFLPFLALQTSVSIWTLQPLNTIIGSLIMCLCHLIAAISAIFAPSIIQKFGANLIFIISYLIMMLFYFVHLQPIWYILVPISILFGISLGQLALAQLTFLMTLSTKLCFIYSEEDDDTKILRRTCVIRRLARAFQGAHDFGLILGSIISAILITYTMNLVNFNTIINNNNNNNFTITNIYNNGNLSLSDDDDDNSNDTLSNNNQFIDYNTFLDSIFDSFDGVRLCGAQACPIIMTKNFNYTQSIIMNNFGILPKSTVTILAIVYGCICILAAILTTLGLDRIRIYIYQDPLERSEGMAALRAVRDSFKDVKLQMSAPLAFFIGFEQAFMYADFSKSYVVCTLGIHRLNLVFLSMGLLQSIAACTLSMLLRSVRRYYIAAVGFVFHACLLMVLILWKPIDDDPALFYVISASWGVCNAIWEMLNFTLLTGLYADNWESAFANCYFFRFLGLSMAFGFHGTVCNYYKLYALGFFMVLSIIPFVWLEIRLENMRKIKNITRL